MSAISSLAGDSSFTFFSNNKDEDEDEDDNAGCIDHPSKASSL
jgi:hypothetical protein